jgi:hypothetical protein
MWDDVRQLIRVRSVDTPEALMLSPTRTYFVRENLKLRLLNARLALLSRNETAFRGRPERGPGNAGQVFRHARAHTQQAQAALRQVQANNLAIEMPTLADSLNAVRNYKRSLKPCASSDLVSRPDGRGHRHRRDGAFQSGQCGVLLPAAPDRHVAQPVRGAAVLLFLMLYGWRARCAPRSHAARVAAYRQRKREREGNKGLRDALKACSKGASAMPKRPRCAPPSCRRTPAWPP